MSLLLPSFWLFFILFFISIFFAFYIPGNFLLKRLHLSSFQQTILSLIIGMALWGWQGFIFGFLRLRWMTYIYLLVFFVLWLRTGDYKRIKISFSHKQIRNWDITLIILVTIGTLLQLGSVFFVGILEKAGMFFCCTPPDALYHIALTSQLIKEFPPTEPGMAGIVVHNYHYLSNLVIADLIRIFHLPLIATIYQYFVVLLSLLLGLSAIAFGQLLKMKKPYIRWLVFFLYFSGDLTFVLTFLTGKGFNFNTPILENALWLWVSPPRVFAIVVFFAGLSLLYLWIKQKKVMLGVLVAFILASLVSFKIYLGIFMAAGVVALFLYYLFTKKFRMLFPLLLTGLLSLILYLPVNAGSGGLVFIGTWRFEDFIAQPNLGLIHFEMAREIYAAHHNWFGIARFEIAFIFLYIVFVFGTIILGIFQTKKSLELFPKELNIFLLSGISISAVFGFFFIQTSGGANSIQFLITVDILGSIYAALACYYWISKLNNKLQYVVIFLIVLFTVPRVFDIEHVNASHLISDPSLLIDNGQLQALAYIKANAPLNAIILVDNLERPKFYVYDKKQKKRIAIPVYDPRTYVGNFSYYVNFLTDRSLFIDGDVTTNSIVQSHGVDTNTRVEIGKTIFSNKNQTLMQSLLHKNKITYIYLGSTTQLAKTPPKFLKTVFKNSEVSVLQVL